MTFPGRLPGRAPGGKDAVFKVKVKEVREKILPELDDDFASDASEFDTLEELRDDIREKVGAAMGSRAEEDFRVAAIDAAVDAATVEVPAELVDGTGDRTLGADGTPARRPRHGPQPFLQMQGKTREELIEESKARRRKRAEARGGGHRDRRGRGDRGLRGGTGRGARAQRRARADHAREAARAAARRTAATRWSSKTCGRARRSSWSPTPPSRFPKGRRRATGESRGPREDAGAGGGQTQIRRALDPGRRVVGL